MVKSEREREREGEREREEEDKLRFCPNAFRLYFLVFHWLSTRNHKKKKNVTLASHRDESIYALSLRVSHSFILKPPIYCSFIVFLLSADGQLITNPTKN